MSFIVTGPDSGWIIMHECDTLEEARRLAWSEATQCLELEEGETAEDHGFYEAEWGPGAPGWFSIGEKREMFYAFGPKDTLPQFLDTNGLDARQIEAVMKENKA